MLSSYYSNIGCTAPVAFKSQINLKITDCTWLQTVGLLHAAVAFSQQLIEHCVFNFVASSLLLCEAL